MDLLNKKSIWALLIGSALLATTACKKDDDIVTPEPTSPTAFTITDIGNNTNKVEVRPAATSLSRMTSNGCCKALSM
ncbi:MAG: hypothetical protein IPL81_02920 [Flavobacteriales bacterium]|nr:hypothetical protein [Flavobacteriales bacterium]